MKPIGGLTLVELILAAVLSVIAAAAVISGYNFLFTQTKSGISRGNLNLQIDYALEKIRLQCLSSSAVTDGFFFSAETGTIETKDSFCITGEKDPYNIDLNDTANKKKYCYLVDDDGNLALMDSDTSGDNESVEVLIDSRHKPSISFEYDGGSEPDYLTVVITATASTARDIRGQDKGIVKKEGIRFWYTTVTQ